MNVVALIFDLFVEYVSSNFKVLPGINLNESVRHYYIHYKDYVRRFKNIVRVVSENDIQKSAKSANFERGCTLTGGEKTG